MNLFFFDLDKTLYAYDFRRRLPALATMLGSSQYHLARTWWADGFEARAEAGEWNSADRYLDHFAEVTDTRRLDLEEWAAARRTAMTRIDGSVAVLRRAAELGRVCLLSNNPAATAAALPLLIPDVLEILDGNVLVSCDLGARKPGAEVYRRALARFGAEASDAFLADDSAANIDGALGVGMSGHRLVAIDGVFQTDALLASIEEFAAR